MRTRAPHVFWLWPVVCLAASGCRPSGPSASEPFALVLAETASPESAREQAALLRETHAELKGAAALSVRTRAGSIRHLVVSQGHAERDALKHLRARLAAGKPLRLETVDVRQFAVVEPEKLPDTSPPEEAEALERVARLLPGPGEDTLESFLILSTPQAQAGPEPRPHGRAGQRGFSSAFGGLGFEATAEASYRSVADPSGRLLIFVGLTGAAAAPQEVLGRAHQLLLAHVQPEPKVEPEAEPARVQKRVRARRKAPPARRKRPKRPAPPPEPEPAAAQPQPLPLVPATQGAMPWGPAPVHVVERVSLRPRQALAKRPRAGRKPASQELASEVYTAWLAWSAERSVLVLVLFDQRALADRLLVPASLGEPTGLAHSAWLNSIWAGLPDVTLEGERLEYLAMQLLPGWLPPRLRKAEWLRGLGQQPVLMAGYRSRPDGKTRWQLNWTLAADPASAQQLYERGVVEPRQTLLQRVMQAKQTVSYEVGMVMREVGDVQQAWHLTGAEGGRLQELYFQRGRQVWVIRAAVPARAGLSANGLQGRVEMLRLWDTPPN